MDTHDPTAEEPRRLRIANRRVEALTLVLEPWGREYPLAPGDEVEIVEEGRNPPGHAIEITLEPAHVVVWGRVGTILSLFRDGREVT